MYLEIKEGKREAGWPSDKKESAQKKNQEKKG